MNSLPPELVVTWLSMAGLSIGSFLNVCIARIPAGRSVVFPPSSCPGCDRPIRWYDNIPLISYILLRGRCRSCKAGISPVYPLVELTGGLILTGLYYEHGLSLELIRGSILLCCLVILFFIDFRHMILPDVVTIPGAVAGLFFSALSIGPVGFADAAGGAAAGALTLTLIMGLYYLVRRRLGMGWGDVKMMLLVGAFLGLKGTYLTMIMASFGGGLISILLLARGRGLDHAIPFGCFLAPATAISYLAGDAPLQWYIDLLRG